MYEDTALTYLDMELELIAAVAILAGLLFLATIDMAFANMSDVSLRRLAADADAARGGAGVDSGAGARGDCGDVSEVCGDAGGVMRVSPGCLPSADEVAIIAGSVPR